MLGIYGGVSFIQQDILGTFELFGIPIPLLLIGFFLGAYATLLPDLDIGTSKVYHWTVVALLIIVLMFVCADIYYWETVAIIIFLISIHFLNHRGLMHEWWFGLFVAFMFGIIFGQSVTVGVLVLTGYYVHLMLD
jgi:hypothetical protein